MWQVETGEQIHLLKGHRDRVFTVAFGQDGRSIASGGEEGTVILHEGDRLSLHRYGAQLIDIARVRFRPGGEYRMMSSSNGIIMLDRIAGEGPDRFVLNASRLPAEKIDTHCAALPPAPATIPQAR